MGADNQMNVRNRRIFALRLFVIFVYTIFLSGISQAQNLEPLRVPSPLGEIVRGLDANERGPDGSTPLQWAVYDQDVNRVRELIRAGADVNAANHYGANAMQLAAEVAHTDILKMLLDAGADVDSANPEGQTALMLVARTGNIEAARLLVRHGATIDAREQWGQQTALMWAAARRHPAMMELLIREGADINAISAKRDYNSHVTAEGRAKRLDSGGLTPLMYSVRENCKSCVDLLVKSGADLDLPDPDGVSPLLLAVLNANWDIAKRLIEAGADVNQWDMFGQAPLFAAVSGRNDAGLTVDGIMNETGGLAIVMMLLEQGAFPEMELFYRPAKTRGGPLSRGTTPLIAAASNGDVEVMQLLMDHGARADKPQANLETPVSVIAGARGNQDTLIEGLHLLSSGGADMNVMVVPHHLQRARGGTPLHYAVRARNDKVVVALVELGADVNALDFDGLTALDYAEARGYIGFLGQRPAPNPKIARLLRDLGATAELGVTPFWPNIGPPFFYPGSIFPLDPEVEKHALVPGSVDHQ
jgi:ankyrin repeat protein